MTQTKTDIERVISALAKPALASSDFDLNPEITLPANRKLRPAGVLIGLEWRNDTWWVYLTKRASHLKHHPGQIAFPGGKMDDGDRDETAAAIREAHEEIGLPASHVKVLGQLTPHETVTGFQVRPVVAQITQPFTIQSDPGEVDEVFCVPLSHVLTLSNYHIEQRRWRGQWRKYYTVPYGPYYIWGATARMLFGMAKQAQE